MEKLSKLTNKPIDISTKFFVLDIETSALEATPESFVFCCLYGKNFFKYFYSVEEIKAELMHKKYKNKFVFAHNAEFDITGIYGNIEKMDSNALFAGSKFISCTNGNAKFGDSYNILQASVKRIGESMGMKKHENADILKQLQSRIITPQAKEYCKQDCKIVYNALMEVFTMVGSVRLTIASSALTLFRRKYMKKEIWYDKSLTDEFFKCYYGGRTEAFKIGQTFSYKFDVNSMYPFIMKNAKFPNVEKLKKYDGDWAYFLKYYLLKENYEGMVNCTIKHHHTKFGFLPYRENGKLVFKCGTYRGDWTFAELRFALKNNAIEIVEFHSAIYAESVKSIFDEYVSELYEKRMANKDNFKGYMYKIFLNSLYGKWGEKNKLKCAYFEKVPYDLISEFNSKGIEYRIIPFNQHRDDCRVEWNTGKHKKNSIPVFASYITALGRIHLLELMLKYQDSEITYVDTDSICCEVPNISTGDELGQIKLESAIIVEINGLKNYKEIDNGIVNEKIKGIPKNAQLIDGEWQFTAMVKTKSSTRQQKIAGKFEQFQKQIISKYDKRILKENGDTEIAEIQ